MAKLVVKDKEITRTKGKRNSKAGVKTSESTGVHGGKRKKTTIYHDPYVGTGSEQLGAKTVNKTVKRKGENKSVDKDITKKHWNQRGGSYSKTGTKTVVKNRPFGGTKTKEVEHLGSGDGKRVTKTKTNGKGRTVRKSGGNRSYITRFRKVTNDKNKSSNRGTGNK